MQAWLDKQTSAYRYQHHLGWTNIDGLLFVNLYFYIFNQQQFRAGSNEFQPGSNTSSLPARLGHSNSQNMYKLLRLKHWQLFILLIGIPTILQFVFLGMLFVSKSLATSIFIFPIIMFLTMGIFFGWFYAVGSNLHMKLPETVNMNLTRFKIFLFIPVLYISLLCVLLFGLFSSLAGGRQLQHVGFFALIIPVHLFSMFCIFYCLYFNAKALKAVELKRPVTFNDFAGEFFLLWFFPIGVWIIQPRINKLFEENTESTINLIT